MGLLKIDKSKMVEEKVKTTPQNVNEVASDKWGHGYGTLPKTDGTPYATDKGAFRNHPCTIWANETVANARWLIRHGLALCEEYSNRYGKWGHG